MHFECMLHGMRIQVTKLLEIDPTILKGRHWPWECHSREVLILGAHFLKTCSVWTISKAPCGQTRAGCGVQVCAHVCVFTCVCTHMLGVS